jgi:hypothetical protein
MTTLFKTCTETELVPHRHLAVPLVPHAPTVLLQDPCYQLNHVDVFKHAPRRWSELIP